MAMIHLTSWPYDDPPASREQAEACFAALRSALEGPVPRVPFPWPGPWQVALIDADRWWMVAVLGELPDDSGLLHDLGTLFRACGATSPRPTAAEFHQVPPGDSISEFAAERGWGRIRGLFEGLADARPLPEPEPEPALATAPEALAPASRDPRTLAAGGPVHALAITPDGRRVVAAAGNLVRAWDLESGQELGGPLELDGEPTALAVTPEGMRVVAGSSLGTITVWDLPEAPAAEAPAAEAPAAEAPAAELEGASTEPAAPPAASAPAEAPAAPEPEPVPDADPEARVATLTDEAVALLEANVTILANAWTAMGGSESPVMTAAEKLGEAHRLRPNDPQLHYAWASALAVAAQYATGRGEMERLIAERPFYLPARFAVEGWDRWTPLFALPTWDPVTHAVHATVQARVTGTLLLATRERLRPRATLFIRDAGGELGAQAVESARIDLATVISAFGTTPQVVAIYARIWDDPANPYRTEALGIPSRPRGHPDRAAYELLCAQSDVDLVVLGAGGEVRACRRLAIPPGMQATHDRLLAMLGDDPGADPTQEAMVASARRHTTGFSLDEVPFERAG